MCRKLTMKDLHYSSHQKKGNLEQKGGVSERIKYNSIAGMFSFRGNHLRFKQSGESIMETEVRLGHEAKRHSKRAESMERW